MSVNYSVVSVSSGSSFIEYATVATGQGRLFEGGDGGIYIYGLTGRLVRTSDAWGSTTEIFPTGARNIVAIAQCGISPYKTLSFSMATAIEAAKVRNQTPPETAGGWSSATSLATFFSPSDAIGDDTLGRGASLVGNAHMGTEDRVLRSTTPYTSWATSQSGLPTGSTNQSSRITDMERPD